MSWFEEAACRGMDPNIFFVEVGRSTEDAKEVCHRCPVRSDCLDYAVRHGMKYGIWGGMGDRQRRRVASRRRLGAA